MSYAMSQALQRAVYQALAADPTLTDLVGTHVYDALPSGLAPPLYVVLGPEDARDASDKTGAGSLHDFVVTIVTESAGFSTAKEAAAAVCDALVDADWPLERGTLVFLNFLKAKAARIGTGDRRQINLTFRARVADES